VSAKLRLLKGQPVGDASLGGLPISVEQYETGAGNVLTLR